MALAFSQPIDIVNRAGQHLGQPKTTAADFQAAAPTTKLATEAQTCYDKLRVAELRRNCWGFATRRVVLRPLTVTTQLYTPAVWSAATTYVANDIKSYNGDFYQAQAGVATGDIPNVATTWLRYFGPITVDAFATANQPYAAGELVSVAGVFYMSLISNNSDTPPTANWQAILGTGATIKILYPIGTGPTNQTGTLNVYRLPYGFLREAPANPKAQLNPFAGGPVYNLAEDYIFEGNYFISASTAPVMLRYVADMIDVNNMDSMFCEGFAAKMAIAMCEAITQKRDKLADLRSYYKEVIGDARIANGIEIGFVDPAEDEYISVRL